MSILAKQPLQFVEAVAAAAAPSEAGGAEDPRCRPSSSSSLFADHEDEDQEQKQQSEDDLNCSIRILSAGFLIWHRLQHDGIAKVKTYEYMLKHVDWKHRYPETFSVLHRGSSCPESRVLGQGKYSVVYQRQNFAFKMIRVEHERQAADWTVLRCNLKELGWFHSLTHPHVMKVVQSQLLMAHGAVHKIIHQMQSARCTLQHLIDTHELTCFQDLVFMFGGIAQGLRYMHSLRVVHGDLKPANIMITPQYRPLISDFTLTTVENRGTEMAFGTLYWRAPECLTMRECRRPADVWAFGMMLLDCLYGCTYMMQVMNAKDDRDMLLKLACIVGAPSAEWLQKYVEATDSVVVGVAHGEAAASIERASLKAALLAPDPVWCDHVTEHSQLQVSLQPPELAMMQDLLSKLLVWDPEQRLTMEQVLEHPVFTCMNAVTPFPEVVSPFKTKLNPPKKPAEAGDMVTTHPVQHLTWRDASEREYIRNWTKFFYWECFHHPFPAKEDWLLSDVTVMAKRLIDHLRVIECTFHLKTVIQWCSQVLFFLWKDVPPTEPWLSHALFESQLFHVFSLLKFQVFAFNVHERFVHSKATAPTAAPETSAQAHSVTPSPSK